MRTRRLLSRGLLHGGLMASVIVLSGCGGTSDYLDPYTKPYTWHPTGAPEANLAAQLVDPHDLVSGRGDTLGDSKQSTSAIERVWQDRPKSLTAGAAGGASSGGASGGPSATAGGGTGGSN